VVIAGLAGFSNASVSLSGSVFFYSASGVPTQVTGTFTPSAAGQASFSISLTPPAGTVAWGNPLVGGYPTQKVVFAELAVYMTTTGSAATVNSSCPYGWWVGGSTHDFGTLAAAITSYRVTAASIRYTDTTAVLYQNGSVACRQVDQRCGPGDANLGSFPQLESSQDSYNGLNKDGIYAPLAFSTIEDRRFRPVSGLNLWELPYVVIMSRSNNNGGVPAGRLIATHVIEMQHSTQLWPLLLVDADSVVMERIDNAIRRAGLVGDNPDHFRRVANFLSRLTGVTRNLEKRFPGLLPAISTMGPMGNAVARGVGFVNRFGDLVDQY
jgi:hypothetical protein